MKQKLQKIEWRAVKENAWKGFVNNDHVAGIEKNPHGFTIIEAFFGTDHFMQTQSFDEVSKQAHKMVRNAVNAFYFVEK